jgi:hypothetical protein
MKLIATQTLTSDQPNIIFTSIPQNFTDLVLFISGRTDRALEGDGFSLRFNGNQSGYSQRRLIGAGSGSPSSDTQLNSFFTTANNATANTFGNSSIYIPNYAGNANKSYSNDGVSENNATTSYAGINAGVWANTAAINSITLTPEGGTVFRANTTASLYGIGGAGDGYAPKATGGSVSFINGYWIHVFTSSGTFTPTESISGVEYLVIAGGGGGGAGSNIGGLQNGGGGGGAGGYRSSVIDALSGGPSSAEATLSLVSGTAYTVTVGAGGAGGSSGSNSVFSTITSTGGGAGGPGTGGGASGGSGGGGGGNNGGGSGAAGSGTTNQGNSGGASGLGGANYQGGGGGGANAAGSFSGGNGLASSITGSSVTRAGGGGGGTYNNTSIGAGGGAGGGGTGAGQNAGSGGLANFGAGGGGGAPFQSASAGGSGIVVVRYAA